MRNFFTIWRRELAACFLSPIAYVTMVVFLAMSGGTFFAGVLRNTGTTVPVTSLLIAAIVMWMTALITVVAMRLFAEEKRLGTIETLMTAPVTDAEVVLGKYAGALSFVVVVLAPAVASIYVLAAMSPGIRSVDLGALCGGCVIILLISAFCLSIGLLVSLMTKNQIIAAIACFSAIWLALLFGYIFSGFPMSSPELIAYISAMSHVDDFSRGSIDTRPLVLYISGTVFMLFSAVRVLESRRWK